MENQKIKGFPSYERYKDSGIDWIGKIPEHWKMLRGNYIFNVINKRSRTGDEDLLSVSEHTGVRLRSDVSVNMFMAESYVGYKICYPNDLVINSLWAWSRGLGISHYHGIVSTAYSVYRPNLSKANPIFLNYLLRTQKYVTQYLIASKGIWISRLQLSDWNFLRIPILLPPLSEQVSIAKFLDDKTAQIDRAIAMKEEQIKLLNERKQIMIQEAVTKGLDPTVPMKDSGIEWIGEIPASWEVKKLKYQVTLIPDRQIVNESELPFIGMENIESWTGKHHLTSARAEGLAGYFQKNDLLFGKLRPYLAKVFLAKEEGLCSTEFNIYRCKQDLSARYYQYLFLSYKFIDLIDSSTFGARMPRASSAYLGEQYIPNFSLNEQNAIADYLDQYCGQVYEIGEAYKKQIQALKEYKTTLINEAVTGKIKVN